MAGSLIVPRRQRTGYSDAEVMNLMAGLEAVTDEQLAVLVTATLGEVLDRQGPVKTLNSVRSVLQSFEQTRRLVA